MAGYPGLGQIPDRATQEVVKRLFDQQAALLARIATLEARALQKGSPYQAGGERIAALADPQDAQDAVTLAYLRRQFVAQRASTTVAVDPNGALDGDGSLTGPLGVRVDGTTVQIVGNTLTAPGGGGGGDVSGPGSSTDKAIARWDGAAGDTLQDSTPLVEDDGRISTLTDPTNAQDAATKAYVDALLGGGLTALDDVTTSGSAGSVAFTSLGAYRHLLLIVNVRGTNASATVQLRARMNSDSGNHYDWVGWNRFGVPNNIVDSADSIAEISAATGYGGFFSPYLIVIPDYRGTVANKNSLAVGGNHTNTTATSYTPQVFYATWTTGGTAAMTRIDLFPSAGNFQDGSRFTLYGLG